MFIFDLLVFSFLLRMCIVIITDNEHRITSARTNTNVKVPMPGAFSEMPEIKVK